MSRAAEILKRVRRIEISTRALVDSMLSGQYHTRFKGHGMQFADLREYYVGDDIRHIDWKVTARTQSAHIKKFDEERELNVYFVVDLSGSTLFGSQGKSKREALTEVCALIAFAAVKNSDKVGLILFSENIERHIPPKKGRAHALRLVTELLYHEPKGKGTNIAGALDYCGKVSKGKGVVFVASDFYGESYEQPLKKIARKHDVIALRMRDKKEAEPPVIGYLDMEDSETGERSWVNTKSYNYRAAFKKAADEFETSLNARFSKAGVERIDLWTEEDGLKKVADFFSNRLSRVKRASR